MAEQQQDRTDLDDYRDAQAQAAQNEADKRTALGDARAHGNEQGGAR